MKKRYINIFMIFSFVIGSAFCMDVSQAGEYYELQAFENYITDVLLDLNISNPSLNKLQQYVSDKPFARQLFTQTLHLFNQESGAITQQLASNELRRRFLLKMYACAIERLQTIKPRTIDDYDNFSCKDPAKLDKIKKALEAELIEYKRDKSNRKLMNDFISGFDKVNKCCFCCCFPCIKRFIPCTRKIITLAECLYFYEHTLILLKILNQDAEKHE
jgi:hypothetical protein